MIIIPKYIPSNRAAVFAFPQGENLGGLMVGNAIRSTVGCKPTAYLYHIQDADFTTLSLGTDAKAGKGALSPEAAAGVSRHERTTVSEGA